MSVDVVEDAVTEVSVVAEAIADEAVVDADVVVDVVVMTRRSGCLSPSSVVS